MTHKPPYNTHFTNECNRKLCIQYAHVRTAVEVVRGVFTEKRKGAAIRQPQKNYRFQLLVASGHCLP